MRNDFWGKSIGGLFLIGIGVLFLLNQTDVIDVDLRFIFSNFWPLILVFIGLKGLADSRRYGDGRGGGSLWAFIMIGLGLVFLNNNFRWLPSVGMDELFKFGIPILLIVIGIRIMFRPRSREAYKPRDWEPYSYKERESSPEPGPKVDAKPYAEQDWKDWKKSWKQDWKNDWKEGYKHGSHHRHGAHGAENRSSFIGDVRIGGEYWELKPLNVSQFIGDTEIDLTRANIPFGETTINVSAFIGDLKVYVPNDVQLDVSVRASSFLGDISVFDRYEGGLFRSVNAESPHYYEADKRIRINVSSFIGDVRVKRVG